MTPTVLGIDISKKDFYVSLLKEGRATKPKKFSNNNQGFESLQNWLKQQNVVELHACMEATRLLAEIGDVSDYDNARQLAAYAGLTRPRTEFWDFS
jgi:transposase